MFEENQKPILLEEEMEDLHRFMNEHGMVSVNERGEEIIKNFTPEELEIFRKNEEILDPLEEKIKKLERVERMKGLFQLGDMIIQNF